MYKILFRIGNENSYIWKQIDGVFLKNHAEQLALNLTKHRVFNVIVPADGFEGLPKTFELKQQSV
jgi:hypothetical protein